MEASDASNIFINLKPGHLQEDKKGYDSPEQDEDKLIKDSDTAMSTDFKEEQEEKIVEDNGACECSMVANQSSDSKRINKSDINHKHSTKNCSLIRNKTLNGCHDSGFKKIVDHPLKSNKAVKSKDSKENKDSVKELPFQCENKSNRYNALKRLMAVADSGEKPYQCPYCDHKSAYSANLRRHIMSRHTGEKPHQCNFCDYKSTRLNNLRDHIIAHHIGEKPHQCPFCQYKTTRSGDLKKHMDVHTRKPHQCPDCRYKSTTYDNLEKHVAIHTKGKSHTSSLAV